MFPIHIIESKTLGGVLLVVFSNLIVMRFDILRSRPMFVSLLIVPLIKVILLFLLDQDLLYLLYMLPTDKSYHLLSACLKLGFLLTVVQWPRLCSLFLYLTITREREYFDLFIISSISMFMSFILIDSFPSIHKEIFWYVFCE